MNKDYILDDIDKNIIRMLMHTDKNPLSVIAQEVGISTTGVHQRVKKLEQAGIIENSVSLLNPKKIGYKVTSFIGIYLNKPNRTSEVMKYLEGINEVVEAHYVTGSYTVLIKVLCIDNDNLMDVLNRIQRLEDVTRTKTVVSLGQEINRQLTILS